MKWMLISMMLANPVVYPNEQTCNIAVDALKNVDIDAVCIPAGEQAKNPGDAMLEGFMKLIDEMEKMHKESLAK